MQKNIATANDDFNLNDEIFETQNDSLSFKRQFI